MLVIELVIELVIKLVIELVIELLKVIKAEREENSITVNRKFSFFTCCLYRKRSAVLRETSGFFRALDRSPARARILGST